MYLCSTKVYYRAIMDDIYMLADAIILNRIGSHLKAVRLRQNITQQSLADAALRVLRTLGKLNVLQPLVDEEQLSPSEYYNLVQSNTAKHKRQRAVRRLNNTNKEESEW